MTIVKCNEYECFNNKEGICQLDELDLDNTNDTFECFDMQRQKDINLYNQIRKRFLEERNKLK